MCSEVLGKELQPLSNTPNVQHGKGFVMACVCGGVYNCKVGDLHQVKGKLNHTSNHSFLPHHTISSGTWPLGQGFLFMQDNDPKHITELGLKYMKSKENSTSFD